MNLIPIKNQVVPPLQASKWLKCPVLLEVDEMHDLLTTLSPFWIFNVSSVISVDNGSILMEEFLEVYKMYMTSIKQGQLSKDPFIRSYFSSIWTVTTEALYTVLLPDRQQMIKVEKPVVQLQAHQFDYSTVDGQFRSMVFGPNNISWGVQFSYPQLYQDSLMEIKKVNESPEFPNTAFFRHLQRWVRQRTIPTPFLVAGKQVNVPIRLGRQCLDWINRHPQLSARGLKVLV
jgi:hypothetical protein